MGSDFTFILSFWLLLFGVGLIFVPTAAKIFSHLYDSGYAFAKILGLAVTTYLIWLLGSLHLLTFSRFSSWLIVLLLTIINLVLAAKSSKELILRFKSHWRIFVFEEVLFFLALSFWAYVRAHEPSIHGLEKFMDFGFINSILRTEFFPPKDLWLTPETINYYYFGHLTTAVLTKLSGIPLEITFNLMVALIFALTVTGAFSLGFNLFFLFQNRQSPSLLERLAQSLGGKFKEKVKAGKSLAGLLPVMAGLLSAFLVALGGNLHAFYAFTRGFDKYWYPDATRFIPYTIHEFPSYSWVVSDLHGHVLDIPFVLLTLALILQITQVRIFTFKISWENLPSFFLPLLWAMMYMTNAWDGLIYLILGSLVLLVLALRQHDFSWKLITFLLPRYILLYALFFLLTLPFSLSFKPFVSGVYFVKDHSLLYMLVILWGFFYFLSISFLIFLRKEFRQFKEMATTDTLILCFIFVSTLLLIFPEIAYIKDIYPLHYRANTMFKLGYQAFIMLSIAGAYIAVRILTAKKTIFTMVFTLGFFVLLIPVAIYPYFAVKSYYNGLKTYQGINGLTWLKLQYPSDYEVISWLRTHVQDQPLILEAVGESYTDFARVSSFTGLPTVVGWPVHEWLWRGTYDEAGRRDAEVRVAYETPDLVATQDFLKKYGVQYVFVGTLERQKYPQADFTKWEKLGKVIFQSGETTVYQLN